MPRVRRDGCGTKHKAAALLKSLCLNAPNSEATNTRPYSYSAQGNRKATGARHALMAPNVLNTASGPAYCHLADPSAIAESVPAGPPRTSLVPATMHW
jgi:hypothetical protein